MDVDGVTVELTTGPLVLSGQHPGPRLTVLPWIGLCHECMWSSDAFPLLFLFLILQYSRIVVSLSPMGMVCSA